MIERFYAWVYRSESRCAWVCRNSRWWFPREFVKRCWKTGIGLYEQRMERMIAEAVQTQN